MARHKGAVGFEIGTSKLGAYSMEDTLEIFEREGYVKYKDLDQYFKDCYFDFENKLSEKEFIEKSKKNIMRSKKYKQFINNEVKMCAYCKKIKPLSSFYDNSSNRNGKRSYCKHCAVDDRLEWAKSNRQYINQYMREYYKKNKENRREANQLWVDKNRNRSIFLKKRWRLKNFLINNGYDEKLLTTSKIDTLLRLKDENNIFKYSELIDKFGSVLND